MKKRSAQLPPTKVLPETKAAFEEALTKLGITATRMRLAAIAVLYGQVETSQGTLGEVITKEMER